MAKNNRTQIRKYKKIHQRQGIKTTNHKNYMTFLSKNTEYTGIME